MLRHLALLGSVVALVGCGPQHADNPSPDQPRRAIVDLSVEGPLACAVAEDGGVYCWGQHNYFSAGLPQRVEGIPAARRVSVGTYGHAVCALAQDNTVWCWDTAQEPIKGADCHAPPTPILGLPNVTFEELRLRGDGCVRATDGGLWCWSLNHSSCAIQGPWIAQKVHDSVVRLGSWGQKAVAVAASEEEATAAADPPSEIRINVIGRPNSRFEAMGDDDACQETDGTWECSIRGWGKSGQERWSLTGLSELDCDRSRCCGLGDGTATVTTRHGRPNAPASNALADINATPGSPGTQLVCWGTGYTGPESSPFFTTSETLVEPAVAVAVGGRASCVRNLSGTASCAGDLGYLGSHTFRGALPPTLALDGSPSPNGPMAIDNAVDVDVSTFKTCIRRAGGEVLCAGYQGNTSCFLPASTVENAQAGFAMWGDSGTLTFDGAQVHATPYGDAFVDLTLSAESAELDGSDRLACVRERDRVHCLDSRLGIPLKWHEVMGLPADLAGLAVGTTLACVWSAEGRVACWGSEDPWGEVSEYEHANLAAATPFEVVVDAAVLAADVGRTHGCVVTRDGRVRCWGVNPEGMLVPGGAELLVEPTEIPGVDDAVEVACGAYFSCVRHSDGEVTCWGYNEDLQVGPDVPAIAPPTKVELPAPATKIVAGWGHTCALLATGQVACWGWDTKGQLGACEALEVGFVGVDLPD